MLRCSVARGKYCSSVRPLIDVGAGAGLEGHAGDGGLALAGGAVARAGGEVDLDGDRLAVSTSSPPSPPSPSSSSSSYSDSPRRAASPSRTMSTSRSTPGIAGLSRGGGLLVVLVVGLVGGLLGGGGRSRLRGGSSAAGLLDRAPRRAAPRRRESPQRRGSPRRPGLLGGRGLLGGGGLLGGRGLLGVSSSGVAVLVGHQDLDLQGLRLLRGVRMLGAGVDLELGELLAGEAVAGQHALDGEADDLLGAALEHLVERARLEAARVARVAVVALLGALVARDRDLLGVDDDDEVARVEVRRVGRLALAAQRVGDLGGEPAEGLALGVDEQPVALAVGRCGDVGLHGHAEAARRCAAVSRIAGVGYAWFRGYSARRHKSAESDFLGGVGAGEPKFGANPGIAAW